MRMRGRLRDSARAAHRRHLLIRHVEAGSVKLSGRAGAIGMASSPTKPCRRNPSGRTGGFSRSSHKLPHKTETSSPTSPSQDHLPEPSGTSSPARKRPTCPMPLRPRPDTTKNRTPEWVCGRCTIRLPGPPPAFDASATCGFSPRAWITGTPR